MTVNSSYVTSNNKTENHITLKPKTMLNPMKLLYRKIICNKINGKGIHENCHHISQKRDFQLPRAIKRNSFNFIGEQERDSTIACMSGDSFFGVAT